MAGLNEFISAATPIRCIILKLLLCHHAGDLHGLLMTGIRERHIRHRQQASQRRQVSCVHGEIPQPLLLVYSTALSDEHGLAHKP
jgi:hypothetical protein